MNNYLRMAFLVVLGAFFVGCASNQPMQSDFIVIDGHRLPVNSQGEVELTPDQYKRLVGAKTVTLTLDELRLLQSDSDAFYGVVSQEDSDKSTLLIGKGSLSEGLKKALVKHGVMKFVWLAKHDYYVGETFAIVDESLEMALAEAIFNFPLSHSIEETEEGKVVTIHGNQKAATEEE